jgi:hypothetical protein
VRSRCALENERHRDYLSIVVGRATHSLQNTEGR